MTDLETQICVSVRLAMRAAELVAEVERLQRENEHLRRQIATLTNGEAWFGAWECGCTDTERSPRGIPEFCPVHGDKPLSDSKGRTKVQLNHSGVSGYGFVAADLVGERL